MRPLLLATFLLLAAAPAAGAGTVTRCDGARIAGGVARSVTDCTPVSLAGGPTAAARQAVGRVAGALKVSPGELGPAAVTHTAAGSRVRFQQVVDGVPVHDGQVAVALAPDGSVQQIVNTASPDSSVDTRARVSRADALLTARRRVPSGFDLVAPATASLVAEPHGGALELAWLIVLPVADPRGDWNVLVSARSGEVLDAYDATKADTGSTRTFAPNPIQTTGDTTLRDTGTHQPGTDAFVNVPLFDLDPAPETRLIGTFADLSAPGVTGCQSSYTPGSASNDARNYSYVRTNVRFEETVAYAAIDRVMDDFPAGVPNPITHPIPVNVHCFAEDNSRYSPAQHALLFGDGGVDDAEDADVVVHELGHAIQNAQVPGFGPGTSTEQAAIGEGFGDLLAAFTYLDAGKTAYQQANRFCVMEWDATGATTSPGLKCERRVDGIDQDTGADIGTYRGTPDESHRDGRYWSAMMTCVFRGMAPTLGTDAARDRILTLAIASTTHLAPTAENGAFADSVTALRTEDNARFGGQEVGLINDCARQRLGFAAARDFTPPQVQGTLSPAAPDGANGWYRTAPVVQWTVRDPESPQTVRSGCQGGTDPADTQRRTITCTASSRGGVTTKTLEYRKDGKAPSAIVRLSLASPRVGQDLEVAVNAVDGVSGVASRSCATPSTAHTGPHTVRCTATDFAGNVAEQTVSYTVGPRQRFTGRRVRVSRTGVVSFRLRSNAGGRVKVTATAGAVHFVKQTIALTADHATRVALRPAKRDRKALQRRLRRGRRVTVKVKVAPELGGRKGRLTLRVRR